MRAYYFCLFGALLLSSCQREPLAPVQALPPSLQGGEVGVAPPDSLPQRRLFGLLPPAKPKSVILSTEKDLPRKIKNSTVIIQSGEGNTAASTGKKAAPVYQATDSSTINTVAQGGNLANVVGDGNDLKLKAEAPSPASGGWSWWKWLGVGVAAGFALRQFGPLLLRLV